jgi:hypothetical protein
VSFVAVTQQFNTTTSMGRLTLNILLSFAQFEREVTGERIRDKIAASKRKGMWMGGYPVLCLFDPSACEWTPCDLLAETTVPWTIDWLACYEGWRATGEWTGGGRHLPPDSQGCAA